MVKPLPSGELLMQREIPRPGCSYATQQATTIADCCFPSRKFSLHHLSPSTSLSDVPSSVSNTGSSPCTTSHLSASCDASIFNHAIRPLALSSAHILSGTTGPNRHHSNFQESAQQGGVCSRRVIPEAACIVQLVDQPIEGKVHGRQAGAPHAYEPHSDCHPPESALTPGSLSTRRTPHNSISSKRSSRQPAFEL